MGEKSFEPSITFTNQQLTHSSILHDYFLKFHNIKQLFQI